MLSLRLQGQSHYREENMAWTAPILREVNCGMEINMYAPAEDEGRDYERDLR